jgi:hypothetical protein
MKKLFTMTSGGGDTRLAGPEKGRRTGGPPVPNWGRNLLRMGVLLFCTALSVAHAHEHVEVGRVSPSSNQLAISGPDRQLALYVPLREFFSGYLPQFPGGWHACELTFKTETSVLPMANGADPRIEIIAVTGPAGGSFAFWEVGATAPTWWRAAGWSGADVVFPVILEGETHAHGRAFTMDVPGTYTVTFCAVDVAGKFHPSANKTITFVAQQPPRLSIGVADGNVSLSFMSRVDRNYDLQACTDLGSGRWDNVNPHMSIDGDGDLKNMSDPMAERPRAFYRLVEY